MGIQSLQDFVDGSLQYSRHLTKYLEDLSNNKTSNLLLVHADSCLKQFYLEHIDWICGGQWNELFQYVERFVNAFRQSDIELVIFLEGSLNESTLHHWKLKHRFTRELAKEALSHVFHNNTIPFRKRTKNFVPPGALHQALRFAFRTCDVLVCSSLNDIFKESILYGKDVNSLGIIGADANYILYNTPNYINLNHARWLKKMLNSCRVLDIELLLKDLGLTSIHLPYMAALLGNFLISDTDLGPFYWDLVEDDHPMKKLQSNLTTNAVLPPAEMRIKSVANFLASHSDLISDTEKLAQLVFSKQSSFNITEGKEKLDKIISIYAEHLKVTNSVVSDEKDDVNNMSVGGFPLPIITTDASNRMGKYKKCWEPPEKPRPPVQSRTDFVQAEGEKINVTGKIDNPEEILKQGTLEEAAQALEQLELKETENEIQREQQENQEEPSLESMKEIQNEEKPEVIAGNLKPLEECSREIIIKSQLPNISEDVINIARKRHQSGQMCPEILQLLLKGEIVLNMALDDETITTRLPIPLLYRPLRQLMYGILFGAKQVTQESPVKQQRTGSEQVNGFHLNGDMEHGGEIVDNNNSEDKMVESEESFTVREWCVYEEKALDEPDVVNIKGMKWGVPPLKKLWFGMNSEDNANRLKAFLSCMKSDTVNMSNTAMVPHRLMLLCCVLRYLVQQEPGQTVLNKQDIDAFLSQALSNQLTSEENSQNLANIKLSKVDTRCIQLSAIFMKGIENAILANDACGSPVPWEFCCPWNFFNGKLFHSKWLQSSMNINTVELCEGKPHLAEKLERLRWCITEGLDSKYTVSGLQENRNVFSPFGTPFHMQPSSYPGFMKQNVMVPVQTNGGRGRPRGPLGKRPVNGNGGTLHVAGVPVAHWNGNKSGVGYSKHAPHLLVGGPACVDLPSDHRYRNARLGRGSNNKIGRGRGLLETPYISPWQQGPGFEDFTNSAYSRYMKGLQKADHVRAKLGKLNRTQVFTSTTRHKKLAGEFVKNGRTNGDSVYISKGHSQQIYRNNAVSPSLPTYNHHSYGRGQWLSP